MSDQSSFINTYIDLAMGTLHENVNTILQLKTREKLTNELLLEKDRIIAALSEQANAPVPVAEVPNEEFARLQGELAAVKAEFEGYKNSKSQETAKMNGHTADLEAERNGLNARIAALTSEKDGLAKRVTELENEKRDLSNRAGHLDTALAQVGAMKQEILAKAAELESKAKEIESLKKVVEELTPPKEVPKEAINTKRKKNVVVKEEELNDF